MTPAEIVRIACYAIAAPAFLYVGLSHLRTHDYAYGVLSISLSALFCWYMVEITIASTGVNTREYRNIGTPMIIGITASAVWMAWRLFSAKRMTANDGDTDSGVAGLRGNR